MKMLLALLAVATMISACNRRETADAGSSSAREGEATMAVMAVKDVDLGRTLNPDKTIGDNTGEFKPSETVYASVQTEGDGGGVLKARWTFQDGQVVDETTQNVATSGPANTEFHVAKPDGFPVGKYRVEIALNGNVAASKEFEVKR